MINNNKLTLPTLRGRMGDWYYYVSLMPFKEVAQRVSLADEIHKNKGLSKMIQRKVSNRTTDIVKYLNSQEQRFFNSLILGIYDGKPSWQEIDIVTSGIKIEEKELSNLNKTFGILSLYGDEKIFAIDGQHRSKAIKDTIENSNELANEEIAVIFVAHSTSKEGEIRTRRLFSTLNRYAKPVNISEIIALDEEDNCAIITRNLVEFFELFEGRILFNQNRSISPSNNTAFTNIIVLYDIVKILLTNKSVFGIKVTGADSNNFTKKRETNETIENHQKEIEEIFEELFQKIPVLNKFIQTGFVDRLDNSSSLLFRPIGQNIFFSVIKIARNNRLYLKALEFFETTNFSIKNKFWNKVFVDAESGNLKTDKFLQKYSVQLILISIGYKIKLSKKDKEIHDNFGPYEF